MDGEQEGPRAEENRGALCSIDKLDAASSRMKKKRESGHENSPRRGKELEFLGSKKKECVTRIYEEEKGGQVFGAAELEYR